MFGRDEYQDPRRMRFPAMRGFRRARRGFVGCPTCGAFSVVGNTPVQCPYCGGYYCSNCCLRRGFRRLCPHCGYG